MKYSPLIIATVPTTDTPSPDAMSAAPTRRRILHVDMDAFYASVEEREDPALVGKPVVVGGPVDGRGVVSAANYEARRFGVHSAQPAALAARLCPHAVFIKPRHRLYAAVSRDIHAVMARYTPLIEPLSLDEAFLDVTNSQRLFGPAHGIAVRIKAEILSSTSLVASVGLAPNKFLAKLASDIQKPDALVVVLPGTEQAFLDPLPVTRVWGVGRRTAQTLSRLNVRTIADLRHMSDELLAEVFGQHGTRLRELAHGIDNRPVVPEHEARSVSHETTFADDVSDPGILRMWLLDLADQVTARCRRLDMEGRTVSIKVRFNTFRTITRSHTLTRPTNLTRDVREAADELFANRLGQPLEPVRLIGVGLAGFQQFEMPQADLFGDPQREHEQVVDSVMDNVRSRFGDTALRRGRSPGGTPGGSSGSAESK